MMTSLLRNGWVGAGWAVMTFLELPHMVDAMQWIGLGEGW